MRKKASSVYSEKEREDLKSLLKDLAKVFINKELEKK